MSASVLEPVRGTFRAIATTVVPEAASFSENDWTASERLVEVALSMRPDAVRKQMRAFIRLVEWLPLVRFGRRFSALDAGRRTRVLLALQDAPLELLRRGLWGVRTLVMLGYYARPAAREAIGYRAQLRGWSARK